MRYPILPKITLARSVHALEQILEIRHSSLYCPRDVHISPYFNVVKPTIRQGFNYKSLQWADLTHTGGDARRLVPRSAEASEGTEVIAA